MERGGRPHRVRASGDATATNYEIGEIGSRRRGRPRQHGDGRRSCPAATLCWMAAVAGYSGTCALAGRAAHGAALSCSSLGADLASTPR
eukprot:4700156-Prymnesium_polylepis.1